MHQHSLDSDFLNPICFARECWLLRSGCLFTCYSTLPTYYAVRDSTVTILQFLRFAFKVLDAYLHCSRDWTILLTARRRLQITAGILLDGRLTEQVGLKPFLVERIIDTMPLGATFPRNFSIPKDSLSPWKAHAASNDGAGLQAHSV